MFDDVKQMVEDALILAHTRGVILGCYYTKKEPVTYKEVASILGKSARNLGGILGQLVTVDLAQKRSLTSALVVNAKTKRPSYGFYEALIHNGRLSANDWAQGKVDPEKVWQQYMLPFQIQAALTAIHTVLEEDTTTTV